MRGEPPRHDATVVPAHTFGAVLRGRHWNGLSVEEVRMPAGLTVPEHRHEGAQLYFLLEGRYTETSHGRAHALRPGNAWFRPPRAPHANSVDGGDDALTLIVTLDGDRFASLERRGTSACCLHSVLLNEARAEMLAEIRRGDPGAATALEGWTLLLLSRAERLLCDEAYEDRPASSSARGTPPWLDDAVRYIEREYLEPISLTSVAAHVAVHPATLAAAFRRFLSTSVGEHIRELRLGQARAALLESKRPIKQIAADAGFYDQAHFGRWFQRRFGTSPAALRSRR
ncbi:MAG: AraC family transcriptional regulator [Acidobacteriota bacterium]